MLTTIAIENYRSLKELIIPVHQLTVITGANGTGKSNIYRALRLLAEAAQGGIGPALAREGGFKSSLWAGERKRGVTGLRLGFASSEFSYAVELGFPPPIPPSAFDTDPEIKQESIWLGEKLRPSTLVAERRGPHIRCKNASGKWETFHEHFPTYDSILANLTDPKRMAEGVVLREMVRSWRFYDHFRTDATAAVRQAQIGTRTPVLGHDGSDLAAAIQTILEVGNEAAFHAAIDDAFPGASVSVNHRNVLFSLSWQQAGLFRPLDTSELSDGTLRYLLLVAALLTPRPPALMILNEPETSLHPDLLPALGRLIRAASKATQIIVVSHASALVNTLEMEEGCVIHCLQKDNGATNIIGLGLLDKPAWQWP